jgi:hypothetical protein
MACDGLALALSVAGHREAAALEPDSHLRRLGTCRVRANRVDGSEISPSPFPPQNPTGSGPTRSPVRRVEAIDFRSLLA